MSIAEKFQHNVPLHNYSTFGIGGPARLFLEIESVSELQEVMRFCHKEGLRFLAIGKGSNCLFDDRGFDGLVLLNRILYLHEQAEIVEAGAGYSFSLLGAQTARKKWAGLEFASGIPGTVGGAVYMNAGAGGSETKDVLTSVQYVDEKGEIVHFPREKIEFGYRTSSFQSLPGVIAGATFTLTPCGEARQKQLSLIDYRTKTQPYGDKSAGCVFRNPMPQSAGALIERCGLKGMQIGGAEVSTLHANFIVNRADAKTEDILKLAELVKTRVKEKTGIDLEMEIRPIPHELPR